MQVSGKDTVGLKKGIPWLHRYCICIYTFEFLCEIVVFFIRDTTQQIWVRVENSRDTARFRGDTVDLYHGNSFLYRECPAKTKA